jgi:hypothetical protein
MSGTTANGLQSPVAAMPQEDRTPQRVKATSDRKSGAVPQEKSLSTFFVVGIAINLLMGLALGVWAYKEWRS